MNLDDLLDLAAACTPAPLERARDQRSRQRILEQFTRVDAENRSAVGDHDVGDPLDAAVDEAARIARAAQVAKVGAVTWFADSDQLWWSDDMAAALGWPPGAVAASLDLINQAVHRDDLALLRRTLRHAWRTAAPATFTVRIHRRDGALRHLDCLAEVLTEAGGRRHGVSVTARDVTAEERARHEQRLLLRRAEVGRAVPARHVPGTELLTREAFLDEVDIHAQTGHGALLAMTVEPVCRPPGGPEACPDRRHRLVGTTLAGMAQAPGSCGLLGPDEYGVLLRDRSLDQARSDADGIIRCLGEELAFVSPGARLRVWGGLVTFPQSPTNHGRDLLQDARSACRLSHTDEVPLRVLPAPRDARTRDVLHRSRIQDDIETDRFRLYSQRILDVALNELTRHEILLRVLDERGRPQPPTPLLEMAEHVGETLAVDAWVIDHALELIGQGSKTSHYQINLSARSLSRSGLIGLIERALRRHEVDPSIITFEVTESAAIDNLTAAIRFAEDLTGMGCRLAVDDFGTGYASLRLLKYLPVDLVKIDGDFVAGLRHDRFNRVAVETVARMCTELGIRTAAEHVPDAETIALLRGFGVDFAQGFAIAEPVPLVHRDVTSSPEEPAVRWDRAAG